MIQKGLRFLGLCLCLLVPSWAEAYDIYEYGICYNILSYEDKTVEVTFNDKSRYSNFVDVPSTIEHNGREYRVVAVGDRAFYNCSDLNEVTLSEGIEHIGERAFSKIRNLTKMTLPKSVKSIGPYAFAENGALKSVVMNCEMVAIGEYVFQNCSALSTLNFKGNVQSIGDNAFDHCGSLTTLSVPSGVTSIGSYAFLGCYALKEFKVSKDNAHFCERDGVIYSKDMSVVVAYPNGMAGEYVLPHGVCTIADCAFAGCKQLTSLTIPSTVTEIGLSAFDRCQSLKSITNLARTPQSVTESAFATFGKLHVVAGCKAAYKAASGWSKFTIVEDAHDDASAIASARTSHVAIHRQGDCLVVEGVSEGMVIAVYSMNGSLLKLHESEGSVAHVFTPSHQGCIVRVGNESFKVR